MLVGVSVIFLSLASIGSASAFPQNRGVCDYNEDIKWKFDSGHFSDSERDLVRDGVDDWLTPKRYTGAQVVTGIEEIWNGQVILKEVANLDGWGATDCNAPARFIKLSANLATEQYRDIAAHEMGHHLEMWHTGKNDHFGGQLSYEAICQYHSNGNPVDQQLSQDDYGHVGHHWDGLSAKSIHANVGFEHGTTWWWKSEVDDFYTSSYSPMHGSLALRWRPKVAQGYVYQTMNFANSAGEEIDARTNYKKISSSTTTGRMKMQILVQRVDYGFISSGCEYKQFQGNDYRDQNSRSIVYAFTVVRTQNLPNPSTSWQVATETSEYLIGYTYEGADVRVRVWSNLKYSDGSFALVSIDTLRARHL